MSKGFAFLPLRVLHCCPSCGCSQMKEREAAIQSLLRDMEARLALAEAAVISSDKEKAAALEKAAQAEARAEQLAKEMVEATEQAMSEVNSAKETFQVSCQCLVH